MCPYGTVCRRHCGLVTGLDCRRSEQVGLIVLATTVTCGPPTDRSSSFRVTQLFGHNSLPPVCIHVMIILCCGGEPRKKISLKSIYKTHTLPSYKRDRLISSASTLALKHSKSNPPHINHHTIF